MAYTVNRRTGEIGIRMALGAERGRIARMILRETLLLVALRPRYRRSRGSLRVAAHCQPALWIETRRSHHFFAACVVMAGVTLIASYLPARRAASVDPIEALRSE